MPKATRRGAGKLLGYAWAAVVYRDYGPRQGRSDCPRPDADIYFFVSRADAERKVAALKADLPTHAQVAYHVALESLPIKTPRARWRKHPLTDAWCTAKYHGDSRAVQRAYLEAQV
jgi:hypothetical protein